MTSACIDNLTISNRRRVESGPAVVIPLARKIKWTKGIVTSSFPETTLKYDQGYRDHHADATATLSARLNSMHFDH